MSELFIKQLAKQVASHPDFQTGITNLIGTVMQTVITSNYGGERFMLYAAKRPASIRKARDERIRMDFDGKNISMLARREGLSPRMVRKIATGR